MLDKSNLLEKWRQLGVAIQRKNITDLFDNIVKYLGGN